MNRVLVIDDMATVLANASLILEGRYEVITCDDAKEAQQIIKRERPDIILADMYLADEGAYRLLKLVGEDDELSGIPVLFTGCDVSVMALSKAFSLGAADFVKKPFTENIVFKKIDEQLKLSEIGYRYDK